MDTTDVHLVVIIHVSLAVDISKDALEDSGGTSINRLLETQGKLPVSRRFIKQISASVGTIQSPVQWGPVDINVDAFVVNSDDSVGNGFRAGVHTRSMKRTSKCQLGTFPIDSTPGFLYSQHNQHGRL